MKIIKKIILSLASMVSCFIILLSYETGAKFVFTNSMVVWRTNFAKFSNITDDVVLGITGQSADNPSSLFDDTAEFIVNGNSQTRWTNWSSTGANRGETVGLHINFAKDATLSKIRLYHFVDHVGCDLPINVEINYENKNGEIKTIVKSSLEDLDRNFSEASGYTSIFREHLGGNTLIPKYNVNGTEYDYTRTGSIAALYTNISFDEIVTDNINVILQCNENWYIGLLELAMNWEYTDNSDKSYWCSIL